MAQYKEKTPRNSKDNFYEIILDTLKRYDSEGVGYEFIFVARSRVRHHKKLWPDSPRWAQHYVDIWYPSFPGDKLGNTVSNKGAGHEIRVSARTLCRIPSIISVAGAAVTKDGYEFKLAFEVRNPAPW